MTDRHLDIRLLRTLFDALRSGSRPDTATLLRETGAPTATARLALARLRARGWVQPSTLGLTFLGLALAHSLVPRGARRPARPASPAPGARLAA